MLRSRAPLGDYRAAARGEPAAVAKEMGGVATHRPPYVVLLGQAGIGVPRLAAAEARTPCVADASLCGGGAVPFAESSALPLTSSRCLHGRVARGESAYKREQRRLRPAVRVAGDGRP